MDDIFETHNAFGKMFVVLEYQVEKSEQASKAYDNIMDWKIYMKDKTENIIILSSYQLKNIRTALQAWLNLNEMIEDTIKRHRLYVEEGGMLLIA